MIAMLLAWAILVYLAAIGLGIAALFTRQLRLAIVLTSPAIGLGLLLPLELTFNRAGLPVEAFGTWLALALGVGAALVLTVRRPQLPWKDIAAVAPFLAAGALLSGAPMLLYGFHWAGNSNGDMGVYVSSASNLLHHGFFDVPRLNELIGGSDVPRYMWFWEILPPNRYGTDAFLAFVSAVGRLDTYFVYMPCSVASFMAFIMAAGALCADRQTRNRLVIVVALVAIGCPLMLFTVYQQILPQLLGQVCLVGLVALISLADEGRRELLQRALCIGCVATALSYVYPEISPLLLVGAVVTVPLALWRHRDGLKQYLGRNALVAAISVGTLLVLQNVQIFTFVAGMRILIGIVGTVSSARGPGVINYYIVPSGMANLWGLVPFDTYPEPWLSIAIVIGMAAFALCTGAAAWCVWRYGKFSYGMLLGLMLQMAYLIALEVSYSSFKTGFVIQAFWAPLAAAALLRASDSLSLKFRISPRAAAAALTALVIASTGYSTYVYLGNTADMFVRTSAQFTELHGASKEDLYGQIDTIARSYRHKLSTPIRIDALLNPTDVLLGLALRGHPLQFEDLDPFANVLGDGYYLKIPEIRGWPSGVRLKSELQARTRNRIFARRHVAFGKDRREIYVRPRQQIDEQFFAPVAAGDPPAREGIFVETGRDLTILNRSRAPEHFGLRAVPWHDAQDWLTFVNSDFGTPPLFSAKASFSAALGPLEPDPYNRQEDYMGTVGKSMLLEVTNGDPLIRLRMALTATFNPRPYNSLPEITIVGANIVKLRNLGFGSARFVTPPIRPLPLFNRRYIIIFFGKRLNQFAYPRTWLMSLYGRDVDLDPRRFALYGRDISIDGPTFAVPAMITRFPRDLMRPGLLYSGIFEDGWMGPKFSVALRSISKYDLLHLRVNIPPAAPRQTIVLEVDGHFWARFRAIPSRYEEFDFPSPGRGVHTLTLRAGKVAEILSHDIRPSWGRLRAIGFEPTALSLEPHFVRVALDRQGARAR